MEHMMKARERMEQRLFEAAVEGNLESFRKITMEDPLILDKIMLGVFRGSPLHLAALHDHEDFLTGVLDLKPELAEVIDCSQRQQSLLHLASARGLVKVVEKLLSLEPDLCLARDRDGRNPVHVAVMKGQVQVLEKLLEANSHAAQVVLDQAETILHLCVKRQKRDCLHLLVQKIRDKGFVNAKDDRGNTVLHLAVATKQLQVVEDLLENSRVDVNIMNASGFTALDIVGQIRNEMKDSNKIEDALEHAGAVRGKDLTKDIWLAKKKEALMVVASLIATIAFQAGANPPGGVWQEDDQLKAGQSIMADKHPHVYPHYLRITTTGFVGSLSTILLLISGLPFRRRSFMWILIVIMWLTITSVATTYAISISVVTPNLNKTSLTHTIGVGVTVWCSLMAALLLVHTVRIIKKAVQDEWSRRRVAKRLRKFGSFNQQRQSSGFFNL